MEYRSNPPTKDYYWHILDQIHPQTYQFDINQPPLTNPLDLITIWAHVKQNATVLANVNRKQTLTAEDDDDD